MYSSRFSTPDLLKGIAVVLMIQVHIMELFAQSEVYSSWIGELSLFLGGPPAAPVFMAVMGYFVARSQKSIRSHILRGLKLVGLGLLLNAGLNLHLFFRIYSGMIQLNPWHYIFGVDILFVAGHSIIIIALLKPLLKNRIARWLAVAVAFAVLNHWLPVYSGNHTWIKYVQAYFWGYFSWSFFPVFPWTAYVMLGYVFYLADKKAGFSKFSAGTKLIALGVLFVILAFTFRYALRISDLLTVYYHHDYLFVLWTTAFMLFWTILWSFISGQTGKNYLADYLKWTGRNVTAIYIIQWLMIGNMATAIFKTQALWTLPLWFVAVLLLSSLFTLGYLRIKRTGK